MMSVISNSDGVEGGILSESAQAEIALQPNQLGTLITRSRQQTSEERLGVYANAYFARLLECLREEFPALAGLLGEETFDSFAITYLEHYPPNSYTLNMLGERLPQFLRASRPPRENDGVNADAPEPDWADLMINLATIERTYSEVFDAAGTETGECLDAVALAGLGLDRFGDARLIPAETLRLLRLDFPVHEYVTSTRHDEVPQVPQAIVTRLVVSRSEYVVRRRVVDEAAYVMLEQLTSGATIGESIERVSQLDGTSIEVLGEQLRDWFANWVSSGLFRRFEISG